MLAGMGGVSYHRLAAAVSEAGGFGCLGASTMRHEEMVDEIAKVRELTDKPFGVDLLTAAPQDMEAKVNDIIDGGATVFVAGLGVPRDVVDLCHRRNVLVVNMCGKVRHATVGGGRRVRHRGRAGHRGGRPHRPDRHDGARAPDRRRGRRPGARGRGRRALRRSGPRRRAHARRRRRVGGHPLHRHARGPRRARLQGRPPRPGRGRHRRHPGLHRQDLPGRAQLATRRRSTTPAARPSPSPCRCCGRWRTAPTTSAATRRPTGVDPDREFFPAGQGVGAIDELVPAAELVRRFVDEAEAALARAGHPVP